jgi:hypothetical protein
MLVITRHRLPDAPGGPAEIPFGTEHPLAVEASDCLQVLSSRPGFVRGWVGRAADDPSLVLLSTEWVDVGSWRRALSPVDVRIAVLPFLGTSVDEPTAFVIEDVVGEGAVDDARPSDTHAGQ